MLGGQRQSKYSGQWSRFKLLEQAGPGYRASIPGGDRSDTYEKFQLWEQGSSQAQVRGELLPETNPAWTQEQDSQTKESSDPVGDVR